MAVAVIVSGFGALTGWTMIYAEMPLAAAVEVAPDRPSDGRDPAAGA